MKCVFVAGGESTWREYLTLPNILKEFNPRLVGYALKDSLGSQKNSQFNVAEPIGMTGDMPFQAKLLVRRMLSDKRVDYEKDWKVWLICCWHCLHVFPLCSSCFANMFLRKTRLF
jgi:hypothetical protein